MARQIQGSTAYVAVVEQNDPVAAVDIVEIEWSMAVNDVEANCVVDLVVVGL